jgi:hypothetical protein
MKGKYGISVIMVASSFLLLVLTIVFVQYVHPSLLSPPVRRPMSLQYFTQEGGADRVEHVKYVREDGAVVTYRKSNEPFRPSLTIIVPRMSGGIDEHFDSETNRVSTLTVAPEAMAPYLAPLPANSLSNCAPYLRRPGVADFSCGEGGTILGYRVFRASYKIISRSRSHVVYTLWVAPDLNWEVLRATHVDSSGQLLFVQETSSITPGRPPDKLFHVPVSAILTKPSELARHALLARGHECPKCIDDMARTDDQFNATEPIH